jgi:hypothetical protein
VSDPVTWAAFEREQPDLAEAGRALLYQFGVGLAFLATVRPDGGPRVHPMCPVLLDAGVFALIVPSPKRDDLLRDRRYALHAFPAEDNEDAFYLTGVAEPVSDPSTSAAVRRRFLDERGMEAAPDGFDKQRVFEFLIGSCLLTRTIGHGDDAPVHTVWRPGGPTDLG